MTNPNSSKLQLIIFLLPPNKGKKSKQEIGNGEGKDCCRELEAFLTSSSLLDLSSGSCYRHSIFWTISWHGKPVSFGQRTSFGCSCRHNCSFVLQICFLFSSAQWIFSLQICSSLRRFLNGFLAYGAAFQILIESIFFRCGSICLWTIFPNLHFEWICLWTALVLCLFPVGTDNVS